jgi:hypothetical protein
MRKTSSWLRLRSLEWSRAASYYRESGGQFAAADSIDVDYVPLFFHSLCVLAQLRWRVSRLSAEVRLGKGLDGPSGRKADAEQAANKVGELFGDFARQFGDFGPISFTSQGCRPMNERRKTLCF